MHRLTITFYGEVQGVGFRATARKQALELKVTGTVQNCSDGSVQAVVEGDLSAIFTLIEGLALSFSLRDIKIAFEPSVKGLQDFLIIR